MPTHLREGDAAPAFEALTDGGQVVQLEDFHRRHLVLYFFPKADTPG